MRVDVGLYLISGFGVEFPAREVKIVPMFESFRYTDDVGFFVLSVVL